MFSSHRALKLNESQLLHIAPFVVSFYPIGIYMSQGIFYRHIFWKYYSPSGLNFITTIQRINFIHLVGSALRFRNLLPKDMSFSLFLLPILSCDVVFVTLRGGVGFSVSLMSFSNLRSRYIILFSSSVHFGIRLNHSEEITNVPPPFPSLNHYNFRPHSAIAVFLSQSSSWRFAAMAIALKGIFLPHRQPTFLPASRRASCSILLFLSTSLCVCMGVRRFLYILVLFFPRTFFISIVFFPFSSHFD